MRPVILLLAGFTAGTVFGISIGAGLRLALVVLAGCLVIAGAVLLKRRNDA